MSWCGLLVAMVVFCLAGCQRENAQWNLAAGRNAYAEGDSDQAIELLQEALRLSPGSTNIKIQLAGLLAENDQGERGLSLCDEVLSIYPKNEQAQDAKIMCLKFLGLFDEALAEYQLRGSGKIDNSIETLNGLAYHRALAQRELDKALQQIDHAIEKVEGRASITLQTAVAVALISRHVDRQASALQVLNDRIAQVSEYWGEEKSKVDRLMARKERSEQVNKEKKSDKIDSQIKEAGADLEGLGRGLSVLLTARALVAEDLENTELADHDRRWVEKLGFVFDDSLATLPSDAECLNTLDVAAAFLDTRGFILTLLPWRTSPVGAANDSYVDSMLNENENIVRSDYWQATEDLDLAVAAAEVRHAALTHSNLFNNVERPLEEIKRRKHDSPHTLAVLLYHRLLAHQKADKSDLAAVDKKRIEALGFPTNCRLF